jgi:hypothetical protein
MPLQKNKIPISFAKGIDTKSDRKQVVPGKLLLLENGVFQTTNSLIKRNGYAAFAKTTATNTTLANSLGIATFKDTLFNLANETVGAGVSNTYGWAYSPSTLEWSINKGVYHPVNVSRTASGTTYGGSTSLASTDSYIDTATNLQLVVKLRSKITATTNEIVFGFKDLTTSVFISSDVVVGIGGSLSNVDTHVRALKLGSNFVIIFSATYGGVAGLYYVLINISDLSTQSFPVLIKATGTTTGTYKAGTPFDAIVTGGTLYISYADGTATGSLYVLAYTSLPSTPVTVFSATTGAAYGSCLVADPSGNIWVGANSGTQVKTIGYTANLASVYFPVVTLATFASAYNIVGVMFPGSSTVCSFYVTKAAGANVYTDPASVREINAVYSAGTVTTSGETLLMLNAAVTSKAFNYNGQTYLIVNSYDGYSVLTGSGIESYFLVQTTSSSTEMAVAKLCSQSAISSSGNAISIYPTASGSYSFVLVEKTTSNASKSYVAWSYSLSFDHKPVFAEMANNLHITGGYIYMYDGTQLCEHGYLMQPTICTLVDAAAGSVAAGTYYYIYTYEWMDAFGQLHISAPSVPSASLTVALNRRIDVTIPNIQLTNRSNQIYIGLYRSSDGVNYYKNSFTGYNGAILSNPGTASITYQDSYAFATAYQGQPLLYTNGGEVRNLDPGATKYLATYNQRMIAIPQEASNSWWYSKEVIPSAPGATGSPVEFSDAFISSIDERGGGIVGIQQIDEKLVFFKANNIFALAGNGPAPNGTGNDFNPPQVIATDSGCIDGQSIVLGPSGVIYKSAKGLYLIDRSMSVSYIGAPVEAYNSQEILSADLIYNLNQFRFGMSSGVVLTYNYLFDQWSVFTNHAVVQACIYQNKYTYAKADGTVLQETPGAYSDAGTSISMKLTTGWLSFAELQGYQRLYKLLLLGEYKSAHKLQVDICVDFNDTIVQTTTITAINDPLYQYRIFLTRQKCQSMKFTIQDIAPDVGTLAEGYSISAMAFEMGVKQGLNKLPAARSVG